MDSKEKKKRENRQYYLKNKEKIKEYKLKNKEKYKETARLYRLKNKEKIQEYRKSPQGIKSHTICDWRRKGVIGDLDAVYDIYLATTECMKCSVPISGLNKHMDHDHETRLYRAVLCNSCNIGNPLDLHCHKSNKSTGIKNITKRKKRYGFEKTTKKVPHRKFFKTIEEAIQYKEQYLSELR